MKRPGDEDVVTGISEPARSAGERDAQSSIVWLAAQCRRNNVRLESLARQAERARDPELAAFFRRAHAISQRLAAA
jgi:hypothetical protein